MSGNLSVISNNNLNNNLAMWSKKRISVSYTPRKLKRPTLLLKRRTPGHSVDKSSNIRVYVRVRPPSERDSSCRQVIQVVDDQCLIFDPKDGEDEFFVGGHKQLNRDMLKRRYKHIEFQFDHVFDAGASNMDVFEGTTQSLIRSLLDGFNCSVFVYGATGAGKTYTMLGSKEIPGIAYLTMVELYKQIEDVQQEFQFDLRISYLEVYNETVKDLISPSGPLNLRDDGKEGVVISGIKTHRTDSADELFYMLEQGNKNRTQHPTDANAESSRSHAVFQVHLCITHKLSQEMKTAKLTMIDLAGSERGAVTGGKGARFSEGSNINKSLLALGSCVDALAEGHKHVPYRNSKLTRILKDSLGGNCKTVMIVNVAPSSCCYEETFNTLSYANRAKKINNKIRRNLLNKDMSAGQYKKIIEDLKQRNLFLENEIKSFRESKATSNECELPQVPSQSLTYNLEIEKGRDVLKCLYELEGKYSRDILMYQMKIKTLDWRIYQKKIISERFEVFEYLIGDHKIRSKMDESVQKLKLQRTLFKEKVKTFQKCLKEKQHMREIALKDIQEKGIMKDLKSDIEMLDNKMNHEAMLSQITYLKDLLLKQQNEMASSDKIINLLCKNMDFYYSILNGCGRMSDKMKEDYLHLVQQLSGIKGVSWQDETCDYNILRKIIDLSFTSDDSSRTSPAVNVLPVNPKMDSSTPSDMTVGESPLTILSEPPPLATEPLRNMCKIPSLSRIVEECPSFCESRVENEQRTIVNPLRVPNTPSIGLRCIAGYASPEDDMANHASSNITRNGSLTDEIRLLADVDTPITHDLKKSLIRNIPLYDKEEGYITDTAAETPVFNKTFAVPPLAYGKTDDYIAEQSIGDICIQNYSPTIFNCTFSSEPSQIQESEQEEFVPNNVMKGLIQPFHPTSISQCSQEDRKGESKRDEGYWDESSVIHVKSVLPFSGLLVNNVCESSKDVDTNGLVKSPVSILNSTFTTDSPLVIEINKDDRDTGKNVLCGDSVAHLNATFTSRGSPNIDTHLLDKVTEVNIAEDESIALLNSTFISDSSRDFQENESDGKQNLNIPVIDNPPVHLNSMFSSSSLKANSVEESGMNKTNLVAPLTSTFSTSSLPDVNEKECIANNTGSVNLKIMTKSLPVLNGTFSTNSSSKDAHQTAIRRGLPQKIRDNFHSGAAVSPTRDQETQEKTKKLVPKVSVPMHRNGSSSAGAAYSSVNFKQINVCDSSQSAARNSKDKEHLVSYRPKINPARTIKIQFNPLFEKNKVNSIPVRAVGRIDTLDNLKKKPSPFYSSSMKSSMKENRIPIASKINTPLTLPKNSEAKSTKATFLVAKKARR